MTSSPPLATTSRRATPMVFTTPRGSSRSRTAPAAASTSARSRSARACTSPIEDPGRMSWKWLSRSVCQASSSPAGSPATAASSSASCSARSARRLARLVRAWLV